MQAAPNHLAGEKSPYLLQHKDNPVDWHPWGQAAFDLARKENKPVFLSIGYSTCHWCHVMAHESFENPEIARLMNEKFINIKVDREERPDVDRVYMAFVQATTGSGGWPMSVWLTPEGRPFFGGTYFPPDDRYGRAGFPNVLEQIANLWQQDRGRIEQEGQRVIDALQETTQAGGKTFRPEAKSALNRAYANFAQSFDAEQGGFGGAPKFPRPSVLNLLLRGDERARDMALFTLRKMAAGGLRDHLGGGFHRYSVDEFWHVPHFEKMLYDQAQLAVSYTEAWQITQEPFFEQVARQTLDYVLRDMTDAGGGFYSAEDADSLIAHGRPEHAEGAFYVWTKQEIIEVLGDVNATLFNANYGVEDHGNSPAGADPHGEFTGKNILIERGEISDSLADSRAKLLSHRNARPRPHLDDKVLTAWNGLMISAFAKSGAAFNEPLYLDAARKAATFIDTHLTKSGSLLRSWRGEPSTIEAFAEDYAFYIQGLLDLYAATFETRWLERAIVLQKTQDSIFWDEAGGSYFSSAANDPLVPVRMKEDYDGAEPSANSISMLNLLRFARLQHDDAAAQKAQKILDAHTAPIERAPTAVPQMLVALDLSSHPARQAVVAGERPDTDPMLGLLHRHFLPYTTFILADAAGRRFFAPFSPAIEAMQPINGRPAFYLCENFACQAPVTNEADVRELLK